MGLEQELLIVEGADVRGLCLCRMMLTNEVFFDEAFRYSRRHKSSLVSLGIWVSSSSTFFLGPVEVVRGTKGASSDSDG